ncbi:hypothetical protein [uncultured Shimia sp.]|uniref:hypothetical protein n=1 Tax=uncultured Shimia sp. TaxID=573152 RepID=UPI00260951DB|nr:hypothetical protein [uncultured Shimia sp.]
MHWNVSKGNLFGRDILALQRSSAEFCICYIITNWSGFSHATHLRNFPELTLFAAATYHEHNRRNPICG